MSKNYEFLNIPHMGRTYLVKVYLMDYVSIPKTSGTVYELLGTFKDVTLKAPELEKSGAKSALLRLALALSLAEFKGGAVMERMIKGGAYKADKTTLNIYCVPHFVVAKSGDKVKSIYVPDMLYPVQPPTDGGAWYLKH